MCIVLFDLDDTLLEGDCERLWCEFLAEKEIVDAAFMQQIGRFFEDYAEGNMDFIAYESFLLRPLTLLPAEKTMSLRKQFLKCIRARLRPFMLKRVAAHQSQGDTLVLITASNAFLARPIAEMLEIPNLICTEIEQNNQVPTGNLLGIPAFREGKVQRLETWLADHKQTLVYSWAYSDSHNDLPILRKVTYPVAVTPEPYLLNQAMDHGWEIIP